MPIYNILNSEEKKEFDSPPKFTGDERKKYFRLNKDMEEILATLRTPTTKVVFMLLYGYLQATGKLYSESISNSNPNDLQFVINSFGFFLDDVDLTTYTKQKFSFHKGIFIEKFGYSEFNNQTELLTREQIKFYLRSQTRHRQIFGSIADKLFKDQVGQTCSKGK